MKALLFIVCTGITLSITAQPDPKDIKKHRIQKVTERRIDKVYGNEESSWYYDRNGNDSLQYRYNDTIRATITYINGRLAKKALSRNDGEFIRVDIYEYEYNADSSYKTSFKDGEFGMRSYEWFDKNGVIQASQSPDGNLRTYTYDAQGRLLSITSDGKNQGSRIDVRYFYNDKGQYIKTVNSVDEMVTTSTYQYDTKGKLIKTVIKGGWEGEDAETVLIYTYNEKGLVKKKVMTEKSPSTNTKVSTYEYEYAYHR